MPPATQSLHSKRITGAERETWTRDYVKRYNAGHSIRTIAADTGRSYGFVHRILVEAGVRLRQRGGARVRRRQAATPATTGPRLANDLAGAGRR